jgi:hypothetical protein
LSYSGIANTNAEWGRQRIKLDRFIGNGLVQKGRP